MPRGGDLARVGLLGRVAFILFANDPTRRVGGVLDVPADSPWLEHLESRQTQIMAAELIGPFIALIYANAVLCDSQVNFFIDNMSGLCAIVKGASRRADLASLANGLWFGLAAFRIEAWFDYVETESNCADGGSRDGLDDPWAASLGIPLRPLPPLTLPADFPRSQPSVWEAWWREARSLSRAFLAEALP